MKKNSAGYRFSFYLELYYKFYVERNIDSLGTRYNLKSTIPYSSTAFNRGPYFTIVNYDKSIYVYYYLVKLKFDKSTSSIIVLKLT